MCVCVCDPGAAIFNDHSLQEGFYIYVFLLFRKSLPVSYVIYVLELGVWGEQNRTEHQYKCV